MLFVLVHLVVLNAGYFFEGFGRPLSAYSFESAFFQTLQRIPLLHALPLPLPEPFLKGIDLLRAHEKTGVGRGPAYLLGEIRLGSFGLFYPLTFLLKVPIAAQLLFLAGLVRLGRNFNWRRFCRRDSFLLIPILFFGVYFTVACEIQHGIRIILMILPLLYIFASSVAEESRAWTWKGNLLLVGSLIFLFISMASYWPHQLSYFNEIVVDRRNAFRYLCDSNLDWGQNELYLQDYLQQHPEVIVNPMRPVRGRIIITAAFLTRVLSPGMDVSRPFSERVKELGSSNLAGCNGSRTICPQWIMLRTHT